MSRRRGTLVAAGTLVACGALAGVGATGAAQQAADATIDAVGTGTSSHWAPDTAAVETGDTVTWRFVDPTHNVASSNNVAADPNWAGFVEPGPFQAAPQGTTASYTFTRAGTYEFVCEFHPGMTGSVVVTGDPVEPTPTPTPTPTTTATPSPTPTPTPDRGGADQHNHRDTPAPTGSAAADRTAPAIADVRAKRLRRGARITFELSETASVTLTVTKGKRVARTLRRQVRAGDRQITVRRLKRGRYAFALQARDATGNRAQLARTTLRIGGSK